MDVGLSRGLHCLECIPYYKGLTPDFLRVLFERMECWKINDMMWERLYLIFAIDPVVRSYFEVDGVYITKNLQIESSPGMVEYLKIEIGNAVYEVRRPDSQGI